MAHGNVFCDRHTFLRCNTFPVSNVLIKKYFVTMQSAYSSGGKVTIVDLSKHYCLLASFKKLISYLRTEPCSWSWTNPLSQCVRKSHELRSLFTSRSFALAISQIIKILSGGQNEMCIECLFIKQITKIKMFCVSFVNVS